MINKPLVLNGKFALITGGKRGISPGVAAAPASLCCEVNLALHLMNRANGHLVSETLLINGDYASD